MVLAEMHMAYMSRRSCSQWLLLDRSCANKI